MTLARKFPHRVSGLSDMYGYTLALVSASCGFDLRPSKSLLLKVFTVAPESAIMRIGVFMMVT